VLKSSGKLEGDHAMHFLSWIERCIAHSSLYKCSHANDTIEGGPTMWMSLTMDGNKQKGEWLIVEHKALKWVKANGAFPKDHLDGFPWQMGWLWHYLHDYNRGDSNA